MTHKDINYRELLAFGWEKTKKHFLFLFVASLIYLILMVLVSDTQILDDIISALLTIAFIAITLVIAHDKTPHHKDVLRPFRNYKVFWHYFLASCVYIISILVGLVLLILPGIYVGVRLQFFMYSIVENENLGPIEALKESWKMTEGLFWKLFLFGCLVILINIIGVLLLGVGLFVTIPITGIAYALLYKKLALHTRHAPQTEHSV